MLDIFKPLSEKDIDGLREYYSRWHEDEIRAAGRDEFEEFFRSGSRVGYENKYFALRHRINGTFMMLRVFGDEYADELRALTEAVCGERTWALPAHVSDRNAPETELDLFAAETGMMLAEIARFTDGALPEELTERIYGEIRRRVFVPFSKKRFHWEDARHNWSAVCAGAIGITYLRVAPDELPLERILSTMSAYISGYNDDGICLEGIGYWSYGFGFYMYFAAELLRERGVDIIHGEKLRRIAEFPLRAALCGGAFASCSDAPAGFSAPEGLLALIERFYGVRPFSGMKTVKTDECGRWAHFTRSYMYPLADAAFGEPEGESVSEQSQWYVKRLKGYGFFIKGGSNAEPHNHNDVGSFIIADGSGQLLCDFGMGEYTRDYFDDNTRYDNLCCSSLGHSVPIIDGRGQLAGERYRASAFECGNGRAYVSFGGAYGDGITVERRVTLSEDGIILRDSFAFADGKAHDVVERFVSLIKPAVTGGATVIGGLKIDREGIVSSRTVKNHEGADTLLYLTDFPAGEKFEARLNICARPVNIL